MQSATNIAFIGLGSNLDDPSHQLNLAIDTIKDSNTILKQSSFFVNPPYGYLDQNDFVNAVIQIETAMDCFELLALLQSIEHQQKRFKTIKWGPRTIDLDILCFNNLIINTSRLTIPHPEIYQRIFVLQPWAEITPEWVLPDGARIVDLYEDLIKRT